MTETTEATARTIIDRYVAVWSEPDAQARRAAIGSLWEPDGVEYVEGIQFRGHEELDGRIARAYEEFVGSGKYNVTDGRRREQARRHHHVLGPAQHPEGEVAWAARVFLLLGETGRIREDCQLTVQPLAGRARAGSAAGSAQIRPRPVRHQTRSALAGAYQDSRSVSASRTVLPSI